MREIKFRAKLLSGHGWTFGDLHRLTDGYTCIWFTTNGVPGKRQGVSGQDTVDPETVGQYTGLKDKNGTEIYEGDILQYLSPPEYGPDERPDIYVIEWIECGFGARWANPPTPRYQNDPHLSMQGVDEDMLIIGNIYENPELLEVQS